MAKANYYDTLKVAKTASADEIKSAYRRLAKQYHPDVFATAEESKKQAAEAKFKEVQHAYDVLSDPQKKAAFDQYGSEDGPTASGFGGAGGFNPFGGGGGGGGFDDIINNIFSSFTGGGRTAGKRVRDGDDLEYTLSLSFKEACFGIIDKEITFSRIEKCPTCNGTGAKNDASIKTCPKCGGTGVINVQQRTPFGVMQSQRPCDECGGEGKIISEKCTDCRGKGRVKKQRTIKINIPAGVDNGQMLTMRGEGNAAPSDGGKNGNLILVFKVDSHPLFSRDGVNLSYELPITILQATLGAKMDVPTLNGVTSIEIPEGTQSGTVIRVKGKGVKSLRKEAYGDLFIKILVEVPKNLNLKQKSAMKDLDETLSKAKYEKIDTYNKTIRNM